MALPVFVFDPTADDELSKVRGVGRYLQVLRENFAKEWTFTSKIQEVPKDSVFINPFFNFLQPQATDRISNTQIAVIHDLIPLKYPRHFPAGFRGKVMILGNIKRLKNYDFFVTDSNASKQDIVEMLSIDERKVKVVYPSLPKTFNKSKSSKYEVLNTKYFEYVGDATWNKNLVNIAKAIKDADITCVFVGKAFIEARASTPHPWQKELYEFLDLAHGDPRFIFPGFVSDEELISLYKNAVANILVSRDEGFGFSYVESASLGILSLLSNISVLKEISEDAALFCDPENFRDISENLKRILTDEDLRNTLGQEAKERAKFFSASRFKQDFLEVLEAF